MWHHGVQIMDSWTMLFGGFHSLLWLVLAAGVVFSILRGINGKYRKAHRHSIGNQAKHNIRHKG